MANESDDVRAGILVFIEAVAARSAWLRISGRASSPHSELPAQQDRQGISNASTPRINS
jgi:hypothetical protein